MGSLGYDLSRRTGAEDNPWYRDHAQQLFGWKMPGHGAPSGAVGLDRATNHVGHGSDAKSPWGAIRQDLVDRHELALQDDGRVDFGESYDAHVRSFEQHGATENPFIDPGHYWVATHVAPALELFGVDAGPAIGASIDLMNDPHEGVAQSWWRRMALGAAELATPLTTPLAVSSMIWNTGTALQNGLLGELGKGARGLWDRWMGGGAKPGGRPASPLRDPKAPAGPGPAPSGRPARRTG
jgi:hypothetical protein